MVQGSSPGAVAGHATSLHELAILMSQIGNPCEQWEELGLRFAAVLHRRTQLVLSAARLVPAHRRRPMRPSSVACGPICTDNLLSPALATPCNTLPNSVPCAAKRFGIDRRGLCNCHLIHAEDIVRLAPQFDLHMLQQQLNCTYVTEPRWMGASKHQCWHWLYCPLPEGKFRPTDLKLSGRRSSRFETEWQLPAWWIRNCHASQGLECPSRRWAPTSTSLMMTRCLATVCPIFFQSTDAMWAVCPGHHRKDGNSAYW